MHLYCLLMYIAIHSVMDKSKIKCAVIQSSHKVTIICNVTFIFICLLYNLILLLYYLNHFYSLQKSSKLLFFVLCESISSLISQVTGSFGLKKEQQPKSAIRYKANSFQNWLRRFFRHHAWRSFQRKK